MNNANNNDNNNKEVCPLAEGGCGNRDSSWCCGCARDETGRLYQPEVCTLAEGGCGNRDSSWCCGCARDENGQLYQPEVCKVSEGGCGNRDSLYICDCNQDLPIPLSSPVHPLPSRFTRETTMGYGCELTRSEPSPLWTPTPLTRQPTTAQPSLTRQPTTSSGLTRQATIAPPRLSREQTTFHTNDLGYEDSDEEQEMGDTFHTPVQSPSLPPSCPPRLMRQETMGFQSSLYDNNYDMYDEPFPSRLERQVCTGSSLSDNNFEKVERSMIVNLNGKLVDLRKTGQVEELQTQHPNSPDVPILKDGGETPPPMPEFPPKLYRGFNNKQQAEDILPALRTWLVIQNDPDIDYEDEVWRDTRDSIHDQTRKFVDPLTWWVLGGKGGPWEYCVETPERFASTMGMNDPYINYGPYMNENKGRFTERQIKLVYDTMMENTRVAMKYETISDLFKF